MSDFIDPCSDCTKVDNLSALFSNCESADSVPDMSEAKGCLPMLEAMADIIRSLK